MTARIAANYLNNAARQNPEMKQAMEDLNAQLLESPGGNVESTLTIVSGSITPTRGLHSIDTEAAAATDDLTNINQTNHPDGRLFFLRAANSARDVIVKHGAGGTGQILLGDSTDLTLVDTTMWLVLLRSGTTWVEVGRFYGAQTRQLPAPTTANKEMIPEVNSAGTGFQLAAPRTRRNVVINGGCRVAQRAAPSISGSYQYGKTDRFAAKADGTPTAGSINNAATALLGTSGFASKLAGITTGASGAVYWRYRIESADVQHLINQAAQIACRVYHDVGSAKNFTLIVNKADASNDFTSVTNIQSGLAVSVPNTTATLLALAVTSLGACGNGIEVIVKCDCAAVTTKNFYLTELQVEPSLVVTPFERRPLAMELAAAKRYYQKSYDADIDPGTNTAGGAIHHRLAAGVAITTGNLFLNTLFEVEMRAQPTVTLFSPAGTAGVIEANGANRTASALIIGQCGFGILQNNSATIWNDQEVVKAHYTAEAEL